MIGPAEDVMRHQETHPSTSADREVGRYDRRSSDRARLPDDMAAEEMRGSWERTLLRHWDVVRVTDGGTRLSESALEPRLHAEACVRLEALLPADVTVELVADEPLPEDHPLCHGRRMFTVASLHNGCYVYATDAPATEEDRERAWRVRISPRHAVRPRVWPVESALPRVRSEALARYVSHPPQLSDARG